MPCLPNPEKANPTDLSRTPEGVTLTLLSPHFLPSFLLPSRPSLCCRHHHLHHCMISNKTSVTRLLQNPNRPPRPRTPNLSLIAGSSRRLVIEVIYILCTVASYHLPCQEKNITLLFTCSRAQDTCTAEEFRMFPAQTFHPLSVLTL